MWRIMWRIRYMMDKLKEEEGIGVVEMVLILVVLIGLVILFKEELTDLVRSIFQKISSESGRL